MKEVQQVIFPMIGQGYHHDPSCKCALAGLVQRRYGQAEQARSRRKLVREVQRTVSDELRHWNNRHRRFRRASRFKSQFLRKGLIGVRQRLPLRQHRLLQQYQLHEDRWIGDEILRRLLRSLMGPDNQGMIMKMLLH